MPPITIDSAAKIGVLSLNWGGASVLNEASLAAFEDGFEGLASDERVQTICLSSGNSRFCDGAELDFFLKYLKINDLRSIVDFTKRAHRWLAAIDACPKPVVAWVSGPALGGGVELALSCHHVVAGPGAKFAFPETGMGIYPGMGGTQRTPRRIGLGLAKWMIYTGSIVPATQALEIGLVDTVDDVRTPAEAVRAAMSAPAIRSPLSSRLQMLDELFADHPLSALQDPGFPMPADPQCVRALVQLRGKAPRALELAEKIIDRGIGMPLPAALAEELAHLAEIFATSDALVGLSAGGRIRPQFSAR
jgi:enoyl-CoA hydratase/3-hydroxyacyl-CoA dehydrogenase